MFGIYLSVLIILLRFIFIIILWDEYYCDLYFIDVEVGDLIRVYLVGKSGSWDVNVGVLVLESLFIIGRNIVFVLFFLFYLRIIERFWSILGEVWKYL